MAMVNFSFHLGFANTIGISYFKVKKLAVKYFALLALLTSQYKEKRDQQDRRVNKESKEKDQQVQQDQQEQRMTIPQGSGVIPIGAGVPLTTNIPLGLTNPQG